MNTAARFIALGSLTLLALLSVAVQAAAAQSETAAKTFSETAERWGLWAALSVLLVLGAVYALYKQTVFVQATLVDLVKQVQRCVDRNTNALSAAPCGHAQAKQQDAE